MVCISKQLTAQKYILKLHSTRLKRARWNLTLPLSEARSNDEVISIGDSQQLRWIDEINDIKDADITAKNIKKQIKSLKKLPNSIANRKEIRTLYKRLDSVQYKPDYVCIIMDTVGDYHRACKGFAINGVKYTRLLGTNGGVKNSTIVFVSERVAPILRERINNGRNESIELVPAKFEAYRALTCSGSTPVSMPKGILVVKDCETTFTEDVITLSDEKGNEPAMKYQKDVQITLNESDGYGLILPSLARRWSDELGLDYLASGFNTRFSWEKGMVFCFDFIEFADQVAHKHIVKDAWGNEVDIAQVELVLTTSMLKLWSSYDSIEHYLSMCEKNHYSFGVTKVCPKALENQRDLNYQFIQSYKLSDEDIDRLIKPTVSTIHDILSDDYRKAILFLAGTHIDGKNAMRTENDFARAIMADKRVFDDPFVKRKIFELIRKKIDDAKIGVIQVHGNYSIVSGDPYSLCQSIFELPVTGLLKKGELFNRYWVDSGADKVACFRAPMTCHNNIRLMTIARREELLHWYRYMNTCSIFNSWDTSAHALNGMDKDGDLVLLTDNEVLIRNHVQLPTIMCEQRNAAKTLVDEEKLIRANIDSFGDDIGKITNRVTTMYDVQAQFEPDNEEYQTLDYRIKCGQLFQQNSIDKAKGIVAKPMPKEWYNRGSCRIKPEDEEFLSDDELDRRRFNQVVLADKKPYFMRYIYPDLMEQYRTYLKNTDKKCIRKYRKTIDELLNTENLSEDESVFISYYFRRMPVGVHQCVMNKICKRFEEEFDGFILKTGSDSEYDYSYLKSGQEYTESQYYAVYSLYKQYLQRLADFSQAAKRQRLDKDECVCKKKILIDEFQEKCDRICSSSALLTDIILDICYKRNGTKQFAWDLCANQIIDNLLKANEGRYCYPTECEDGDIGFCGKRFRIETGCVYEGNSNE